MNGKLTATLSVRGRLKATLSKAIERVEPIIKLLEITENGNYSAPEGVHGFNPVNVNVPLKYEEGYTDGYQASQDSITLQEKTITENGEYETDEGFIGMSKVTVAVPIKEEQEKTVEITKNGTTEVVADEGKSMSKVTVNTNVAFEGDIGKPYLDTSTITDFSYFCYGGHRIDTLKYVDTSNGQTFTGMFYNTDDISVPLFDTSNGVNFDGMFYGGTSLTSVPLFNTSNGVNFDSMFRSCKKLTSVPGLDISKASNVEEMFYDCQTITTIPPFDFSNVTNFSSSFAMCSSLTTIPKLDVSNATNLYKTFYNCKALTTIPLLDISKCKNFTSTFEGCVSLKNLELTIPLTQLRTDTFKNCTALENLTIGEGWAVNIYLHYSNNLTVESLHGMIENLADLTGQTAKTFQIGATNLAKIDDEHINMLKAKNWNYS
jgi:hypothetical protein